jgi:hypothetical protein
VISALLLLFLSSCGLIGGTEAGNPSLTPGIPQNPVDANLPQNLESVQIVNAICTKLIQCHPTLNLANCHSGVEAQTNITPALGVASSFGTVADVIQAETVGTLRADPTRAQTCVSEISAQSCVSPTLGTATYSPASPTNFTGVINMIPTSGTSCAGVF